MPVVGPPLEVGDQPVVAWTKPGEYRMPLAINTKPRPFKHQRSRTFTGQWTQAEGSPQMDLNSASQGKQPNWDWEAGPLSVFVTDIPPNGSYPGMGHVYWETSSGKGMMAWGFWTLRSDGKWWLAVGVSEQFPAVDGDGKPRFSSTYYLGKYDIPENGGQLAQGDDVWGGGVTHGSLSLHYNTTSNTLTVFGPLTDQQGRFHVYRIILGTGAVGKTTLTKPAIQASAAADALLIGHWSPTGQDAYPREVQLWRAIPGGTHTLKKTIPVEDLVAPADILDIIGNNPNNGRARGRYPYDPAKNCFYMWACSRSASVKALGSLREYLQPVGIVDGVERPDAPGHFCGTVVASDPLVYEQTYYDFFEASRARLNAINATTGAITVIQDVSITAGETITNTESQTWFGERVSGSSPVPLTDRGWTSEIGEGSVSTAEVYNHLLLETPEPVLTFPLQARNDTIREPGFPFAWQPPQVLGINQGPGSVTISTEGKKTSVHAVPVPELYGSDGLVYTAPYSTESSNADIAANNDAECCALQAWYDYQDCLASNPYDNGTNPTEYEAWNTACTAANAAAVTECMDFEESGVFARDVWHMSARRVIYRTRLQVWDEHDSLYVDVDISRKYLGLRDYYSGTDEYRDYEEREILDQVWEAHFLDSIFGDMILVLRDIRDQIDSLTVSEARPVLEIRSDAGELLAEVDCSPKVPQEGSAYPVLGAFGQYYLDGVAVGESGDPVDGDPAKFQSMNYLCTPTMRWGLVEGGFYGVDVITAWDNSGGVATSGVEYAAWTRITKIRWNSTAWTDYTVTTKDKQYAGAPLTDIMLDGLAVLEGKPYIQFGPRTLLRP